MARPREPVNLLAAKGKKHLTKAEIEQRKNEEITAACDNVMPPSFLSAKEKRKFNEIAGQLIDIGIMTNLDCDILGRYIRADSEYTRLSKELQKVKFATNVDGEGVGMLALYNLIQKMQIKAAKQCNECARELGLTISSRCKLVMPKKEEQPEENKFLRHVQ